MNKTLIGSEHLIMGQMGLEGTAVRMYDFQPKGAEVKPHCRQSTWWHP